jgi:hypothetical protein
MAVDGVFGPMDPLVKSAVSSDRTLLPQCNINFHEDIIGTLTRAYLLPSLLVSVSCVDIKSYAVCMPANCRQAKVLAADVDEMSPVIDKNR